MIKNDVGLNAGDVFSLLSQHGRLSLKKIGELTQTRKPQLFLTLGWLLREDKIFASELNGEWYFELNFALNEIYY